MGDHLARMVGESRAEGELMRYPKCPRCGCGLELEYDDEGYRCGAECLNCDWPNDEEE